MQISVYQYTDYKKYLSDWLTKRTPKLKGGRSRMAEAIGSKHSYLSRVLNGEANLSSEQADLLNKFFGHTPDESHFFILLLSYERAGTPTLKQYFRRQMDDTIKEQFNKSVSKGARELVNTEHKMIYYSAWYYAGVRSFLDIGYKPDEIAKKLELPKALVSEVIAFLQAAGLIVLEKGRYKDTGTLVSLDKHSPLRSRNYSGWRLLGIRTLEKGVDGNAFFGSLMMSVAEKDIVKAKQILQETIEKFKALAENSGEETMACINLDFFKL